MPASDLYRYGHAGGSGLDSQPLQVMPALFLDNFFKAAKVLYGEVDTKPVGRCDLLSTYNRATDTITAWSFSSVDKVVNAAKANGCSVLINVHPRNYSANSGDINELPFIQPGTGKMDGQMTGIALVLNHYAAEIADGTVAGIEIYNEPNSIGSIQGHLDGPGANYSTGVLSAGGGTVTMNGRAVPYYEVIGRYVKDTATAIRDWLDTHSHPTRFIVSGPCTGAIDLAYYRAILDWAYQANITNGAKIGRTEMTTAQKNADRGLFVEFPVGGSPGRRLLTHCSVHVYQNHDPLTEKGSASGIRVLDTIGTHFRPLLTRYQGGSYTSGSPATSLGIIISEGISAGSNKWNRWQTFGGVEGKGKAALDAHGGIINDLDDSKGRLSQVQVNRNFYRKARLLNGAGAGIEMILPHVFIRETDITLADATTGSEPGLQAWQDGRAYLQIASGGSYPADAIVMPVFTAMKAELSTYARPQVPTAPSIVSRPAINDLTPVVGQTLGSTDAVFDGNPTPTISRQWNIITGGSSYPGTGANPPTVAVEPPSFESTTKTTLVGNIDTKGLATTWTLQLGTTTAYEMTGATGGIPAGGSGTKPWTATFIGLVSGTTYHYRLTATSSGGTTTTADFTFTPAGAWSGGTITASPIAGATGSTYVVPASGLGKRYRLTEVATNGVSPDATSVSVTTLPVTDSTPLVPVNQTPPSLSDADGPLSVSNHPNPGKAITVGGDTWSPDPTSTTITWERMAPDGTQETI